MGIEVSFVSDKSVLALLAFEMAQWVEGSATNAHVLSSILEIHMEEGENQLPGIVL